MNNSTDTTLFIEVLKTCRAKSSVDTSYWKKLKEKIEERVKGEHPDIEIYKKTKIKVVTRYKNEKLYDKVVAENSSLKNEINRLKNEVMLYRKREADISKVLKRSLNNQFKELTKREKRRYFVETEMLNDRDMWS